MLFLTGTVFPTLSMKIIPKKQRKVNQIREPEAEDVVIVLSKKRERRRLAQTDTDARFLD